jgi:YgiT-type zinc finger domain-containing protein
MKCVVCRSGGTGPGTATVTIERDGAVVVVRGVPAQICENCGEEYLEGAEVARLQALVEATMTPGVRFEVRDYLAA